ncbi:hypothetical protein L0B17_09480 [Shewanella sp. OMA3-2]|nr:hypothetical protein [Shewanella sp. OMA3-2]UJF23518.1 hypothetical protein L0B17_09480 [Shewanella sp. OMA3-2]
MLRFAELHGFTFPYLVNEDQHVGQHYGTVCTPKFLVLMPRVSCNIVVA